MFLLLHSSCKTLFYITHQVTVQDYISDGQKAMNERRRFILSNICIASFVICYYCTERNLQVRIYCIYFGKEYIEVLNINIVMAICKILLNEMI